MRVLTVLLLLIQSFAFAQDDAPPVITADNVRQLGSVHIVPFELLPSGMPGEPVIPLSGWFTVSPDGGRLAFIIDGGVLIADIDTPENGGVRVRVDATTIDARWDNESRRLATLNELYGDYFVVANMTERDIAFEVDKSFGVPVRIWYDAENAKYIWIETTPAPDDADRSKFQVVRFDMDDPLNTEPLVLPTGPEHDFDSMVRIGRIPAPLAITATFEGTVRRWDLQTGEVTAEVTLPVAPTFGRVNETNGVEFAWRDEASTALHLLNFETGEDIEIAPLHGEYVQALSVTPDASVILAVHRGDDPTVTAWIVETGEEIDLGQYDTSICSRVPDMVQLAQNGTRLIIGCDGGFEVWEVQE